MLKEKTESEKNEGNKELKSLYLFVKTKNNDGVYVLK